MRARAAVILLLLLCPLAGCAGPGGSVVLCSPLAEAQTVYAPAICDWPAHLAQDLGPAGPPILAVDQFDADGRQTQWSSDAWVRDAWLFAWQRDRVVVLLMPGEKLLGDWARSYWPAQAASVQVLGVERDWPDSRFDEGGNVMVSPPCRGRPAGRLIVGRDMQPAIKRFLTWRTGQASGSRLIELDTAWLKVGHVDEIIAFVPADSPLGFRLALPDPLAGLKLMRSVSPERAVFADAASRERAGRASAAAARFIEDEHADFSKAKWKYVRIWSGLGAGQVAQVRPDPDRPTRLIVEAVWDLRDLSGQNSPAGGLSRAVAGRCDRMPIWFQPPDKTSRYVAVETARMWVDAAGDEFPAVMAAGELAGDPLLPVVARRCANRLVGRGGVRDVLADELGGLADDDVLLLPAVVMDFGTPAAAGGSSVGWLTPNPVNLVNFGKSAVMLRPFGPRSDPADDSTDVFATAIAAALADAGVEPVFVDGWDALHRNGGGAHCGTNVLRSRPASGK